MLVPFIFRVLGRPEHTVYSNFHTILIELLYLILLGTFFLIYILGDGTKPESLVKYYGNFVIGITLLIILTTLIVCLVDIVGLIYGYTKAILKLISVNKKVQPDNISKMEMVENSREKMESPRIAKRLIPGTAIGIGRREFIETSSP